MHQKALSKALPEDKMGSTVKNLFFKDALHGSMADNSNNDPLWKAAGFTAQVVILNHLGQFSAGCAPELACHTAHIDHNLSELKKNIDHRSWKKLKITPNS